MLVACAPVEPPSVRELAGGDLWAGVSLDAGVAPGRVAPVPAPVAPALAATRATDDAPRDDHADPGEAPVALPTYANHEPEVAPRALAYECRVPDVPIVKAPGCRSGGDYPRCRWQLPLPRASGGLYAMWRNTTEDRWWGRPGLVGVLLAAAREFERLHPDQILDIGDLDAAGPRHATHDRGVDVDIYLRGAMVTENEGAGALPWNYRDADPKHIEALRWRVEELARILATCTNGDLRIYYNDPIVERRFLAWYREQGYESSFGAPMLAHNELHQFHFHVTVADDAAVPPRLRSHPSARAAEPAPLAALSPPP